METRTVHQWGTSTVAVALPAAWAREYDVNTGDEVLLRLGSNGMLTVSAEAIQQQTSEAIIHADPLDAGVVERALLAQYVLGQRTIQVTSGEGEPLEQTTLTAVYTATPQLMGGGVIEETPERLTIRCSVDPTDFSLTALLERLESTGRTMRDEAIRAFDQGTPELAERALNRERQANKLFLLLLRLIVTAHRNPSLTRALGIDDEVALIGYRAIAKNLELTTDHAADIAELALAAGSTGGNVDDTTLRRIRAFTEQVHALTEKGIQCVGTREYDLAMDVRQQFAEIEDHKLEILTDIDEMPNEDFLRVHEVLVHLQQTAQNAVRNVEIGTNLALTGESPYTTIT